MFGIASFAQVPFASLASVAYADSITENVGMDDASTQRYDYLQSIAEPMTITQDESFNALFVIGVT